MKRWLIGSTMVWALTVLAAGPLALAQQNPPEPPPPTYTIEVQPPAPRIEVRGVAPAPEYLWVPGYWDWNGRDYIWRGGKWMELPSPKATWVPGHWEQTSSGWAWYSGYWSQ